MATSERETVECEIEETTLENDKGFETPGVVATCSKCGRKEESFGTSARSIRRCLVLMRENCEEDEQNFYTAEGSDD